MLETSGDKLLGELVVCVSDAGLLIRSAFFVVDDYALYFVQKKCAIVIDVSRRLSVLRISRFPVCHLVWLVCWFRQRAVCPSNARIAFEGLLMENGCLTD